MPLQPYNIDTVLNPAAPRPSTSMYPPVSSQDESSLLSRIGGGMLSGVGALGRFLDSTFGGRAIRGLLGGHPRELLSPLPFSDSLHITNPEDFTTGRQLLEKAGLVGAPEPGLELGDVAGFAADVALNPLTYFNPLGAYNEYGRLWAKMSPQTMPRGIGGLMRGGDYAAEDVAKLAPVAAKELAPGLAIPDRASLIPTEVSQAARAQGLELNPRFTRMALHEADVQPPVGLPTTPPATGPNAPIPPAPGQPMPYGYDQALERLGAGQYPAAGQYVGNAGTKGYRTLDVNPASGINPPSLASSRYEFLDAPSPATGTPLASAFGFKVPFGPQLNFGTGPLAQKWADKLDSFGGWIKGLPVVRALTQRLHPPYMNRIEPEAQELASQTYRPVENQVMTGVRKTSFDLQHEIAPQLQEMPAAEGQRLATLAAENRPIPLTAADYSADLYNRDPQLWAKMDAEGKLNIPDATFESLAQTGQKIGQYQRGMLAPEAALGMPAVPQENYAIRNLVRLEDTAYPAGAGAAKGLSAKHASQIARNELWKPFPGGATQINDLFKARNMAGEPLYTGPGRLATDAQAEDRVLELIHGHSVRQLLSKEQLQHAQDVSEYLKASDPRRAFAGYFDPNPVLGAGTRGTRSAVGTAGAETTLAAVRRYGKPLSELGTQDVESVPEYVRRAGLTGKGLGGTGDEVGMKLAAQRLGLESTEGLENFYMPKRITDNLLDISKTGPVGNTYYDKALNAYRAWLYGAWPAAQARNRAWGVVSNWLRGVGLGDQVRGSQDMWNLIRGGGEVEALPGLEGLTPGMSAQEVNHLIRREMYGENAALTQGTRARFATENSPSVSSLDRLAQTWPEEAPGQTRLQALASGIKGLAPAEGQSAWQAYSPANLRGVADDVGPGGGNAILRQTGGLAQNTEDINRGSMYLPLRRQGYSPEAAGQLTQGTHHMYSDLTNWERSVGRRLALFPTFSLRNLPMLAKTFAESPAKLNALIQASSGGLRGPEDFVPPYLAESTAIPLGGASEEGQQRYLSGFGFGYEDEAVRALGSLLGGQPSRAVGAALGQLSPAFKLPIEVATGTQLHTGRKLEDLRAGTTATALSAFNEDKAGTVAQVLANSPAARAVTTLDQFLDSRKGLLPKASNLLTGVKFTDVDLARQKEIAARQIVEEALKGKPGFGNYERLYVKPEKVGGLSPDEFQLMSLYTQLERKAQEAARLRKAQTGLPPGLPLR